MTGFEFYQKINKIDNRAKVCFITAFEVYYKALLEKFADLERKCFIRKPISVDELVDRIKNELNLHHGNMSDYPSM
jgi:two-component system, OmpR family, response regulator ChvI